MLVNVGSYGILIFLLALLNQNPTSYLSVYTWAYRISLVATMAVPIIICTLLVINIGDRVYKYLATSVR